MQAHEVFVHVIAYLKERILNEVGAQNSGIDDVGIQYVMTVPAIWSDAAKQFMREAATDPRVGHVSLAEALSTLINLFNVSLKHATQL